MIDLVVKNGKIVFPNSTLERSIGIDKGKIVAIGSNSSLPQSHEVIDAEGKFVLPGGVDSHDHTRIDTRDIYESLHFSLGGVPSGYMWHFTYAQA